MAASRTKQLCHERVYPSNVHVGFVLNACVHIVFLDFLVVIATRQSEGDYSVVCVCVCVCVCARQTAIQYS